MNNKGKRIYEIIQTMGHPIRVLAIDINEAIKQANPLAGDIMEVKLFDSRPIDQYTSKLWLEKVLNFKDTKLSNNDL